MNKINLINMLISNNQKTKGLELNLSYKNLNEIPIEVFDLEHLEVLKLIGNNIELIPKEIGKLKRLTHLYLHENNIKELPVEVLREIPFLEHIDIGENPMNRGVIKDVFRNEEKYKARREFFSSLKRLNTNSESFYFFGDIHEIPTELFDFNNLKEITIFGQNITEIPDEISKLDKLVELNLYCNKICSIPNQLYELTSLESINLDSNNFTIFPEEILKMPNIKSISFNDNKVTHIKKHLDVAIRNKKINHFSFAENPLKDFDADMFNEDFDNIKKNHKV